MSSRKFYAVRKGRNPGIYETWSECSAQVNGFSGAEFKSFATLEAAGRFLSVVGAKEESPVAPARDWSKSSVFVDGGQNAHTGGVAWGRVVGGDGQDLVEEYARLLSDMELREVQLPGGRSWVIVAQFAGVDQQNNGAELLAMVAGLRIALASGAPRLCSDSDLLVKWWSRGHVRTCADPRKLALIHECVALRAEFERGGGAVAKIAGADNPADLGFHRD